MKSAVKLFGYHYCHQTLRKKLQKKANQIVRVYPDSVYIFRELMTYLEHQKVVMPGYSTMQDIVGQALTTEEQRLETALKKGIPKAIKEDLDTLFTAEDGLHEITFLKKEARNFNYTQTMEEVKRQRKLKPLYDFAKTFLPQLGLSSESLKHYASMVGYYTPYKLRRMASPYAAYLYLLCFVFNRFLKVNDNLVNCFLYYVDLYQNGGKEVGKAQFYQFLAEGHKSMENIGDILQFFIDAELPDSIEFGDIRSRAFALLPKDKFLVVVDFVGKDKPGEAQFEWNHYNELAQAIKTNVRPVFITLDFSSRLKDEPLMSAVKVMKQTFPKKSLNQIDHDLLPQEKFIPARLKRHLYDKKPIQEGKPKTVKVLSVNKYEFLVYSRLKKKILSGDVFFRESLTHKSFDDDLIPEERWEDKGQKERILLDIGLPYLLKPIDILLKELEEELETGIKAVNEHISKGQNQYIKIQGQGTKQHWTLPYRSDKEIANNPFYEQLPQISVGDVLHFVEEKTDFLEAFTHLLPRYSKNPKEAQNIIACITAYGTNIGFNKMAAISDVNYHTLTQTADTFVRLETLKAANTIVSNATAQLPVCDYYNIEEDAVHSSSDGQKFGTQFDTINSRHSSKYFGLGKGGTSYTLSANHIPINAKIIGANEHESHFVFDLLFNNTTEIEPQIHSTDTHGTNEVNFAILYLFGYQFAPRYANLSSKEKLIYGFRHPNHYQNCFFKPCRKINTDCQC